MKKRNLKIFLTILVIVIAVLVFLGLRENSGNMAASDPNAGSQPPNSPGREPEHSARHDSGASEHGLLQDYQPKNAEKFSSTVHAEIRQGETLVLGGYQLPDGSHEFTMLTPSLETMEDGSQMISIQSKTLTISPDFARQSGMDTLTTRYPTADQHAEAWSEEDMRSTLLGASTANGTNLMNAPRVTAVPGQPITINIAADEGKAHYSIETAVHTTTQGGFSITSRMMRTSPQEP